MTREGSGVPSAAPVDVAYGADRPAAGAAPAESVPRISLVPGEALRLNSERFVLPPPPIGQGHVPLDQRLADHLKRLSGTWNRLAASFVDAYFAYLQSQIETHRGAILDRLAPLAGLFAPEDTLYSAPLPLPRALVRVPSAKGSEWVPADMLFWDGQRAKAVLFSPSPLLPGAERRRREHLLAASIEIAALAAGDLAKPETFPTLLGPLGADFWRDEALPVAPGAPPLPEF
ncbi:hypothetical protein NVS89_14310 [Ancylobacter sp. MQZ15Z-1]|uniref:Uncharacterized protein n=1 Tax=Ancylobacter mangrovi TaxID=2972472 RepID=A0A9X2PCM5_9HYPH|nr:hypothetical protein [Ancylobacter mangrovi]MCS0496274.1 hypothetical protein [Ancylobacter mangrovi]